MFWSQEITQHIIHLFAIFCQFLMPHSLSRYVNAIVTYIIFTFIKVNRILTGMCITTKAQSFHPPTVEVSDSNPLEGHWRSVIHTVIFRSFQILRVWPCRSETTIALELVCWGKAVMVMSMGQDCGFELRLPTGLLFIPYVIYGRGEQRWDDIAGETGQFGEKPVPVPLYPPQIPYGLTRARTRTYALRGRRLTAWAMTRPCWLVS
jgi:hypothetical protein